MPSKYRDDVPHVVRDGKAENWVLQGERLTPVGVTAPAGWPTFPPDYPPTYQDCHPGAYDAKARLEYMDEAGIWAQVLYPNVGGFGSQNFLKLDDDELKLLCVSAYNDFLLEWSSADTRRLLPVVATPFWDIDATVKELERCIEAGAWGILFTGEPQRYGLPVIGARHWDPLWDLARAARLPIHFHIGNAGSTLEEASPQRYAEHGVAAARCLHRGVPVHEERRTVLRPDHLGGAQPVPGPEVRVSGERHRVVAFHAGSDRLQLARCVPARTGAHG